MATLNGLSCLELWTLCEVQVAQTASRFEVIVHYERDRRLGNINRHCEEVDHALRVQHFWPDQLPVKVLFERAEQNYDLM